jgi:hypothetical protein
VVAQKFHLSLLRISSAGSVNPLPEGEGANAKSALSY